VSGRLTLVHAGAGTGKTYDLCNAIAAQVVAGADPARILATTFTRKAAAELKGRILTRILTEAALPVDERVERASHLELAAVGTVDSVGRQLLLRYALELGLSPRLEVLDEAGEQRALRGALTEGVAGPWEELTRLCRRFQLGEPHDVAQRLLQLARANRIDGARLARQLEESADALCAVMAPGGPSPKAPGFEALYAQVDRAAEALRPLDDTTIDTGTARQTLRALQGRAHLYSDFARAAKLKAGKKSGANQLLDGLRALAQDVLRSAELHVGLRALAAPLGEAVDGLSQAYSRFKEQRGLLDFTDLEVRLLELLERDDLLADLAADLESVVVDEFQDTNPLQLAIFQRLRRSVASSRWVGDPKQSIYAFRGAAPELVHAVMGSVPKEDHEELGTNWRSVEGLVELVGDLFERHYPGRARLKAERGPEQRSAERWVIAAKNLPQEHAGIAAGVSALHAEGVPLRDIAVLARKNDAVQAIGAALRARGLPVLAELPGLLATREGAVAFAGLRRVTDHRDDLAAAEVAHLLGDPGAATPSWLPRRLAALADGDRDWKGEPAVAVLDALDQQLPPALALQRVIVALDLPDLVAEWGNAAARLANLDTLVQLALQWEQQTVALGLAPTLAGLVAHLDDLARDGVDTIQPPFGVEAVTVLTYHRAKGLEWPVVVLTGSDTERQVGLEPVVTGGDPGGDPLDGRRVSYWPWPFGRDDRGRRTTWPELEELVLASAQARDQAATAKEEAVRLLYVGFTRARDRLAVAHRGGKEVWPEPLPDLDRLLPPEAQPGEPPPSPTSEPAVQMVELPLGQPPTTWVRRVIDGEAALEVEPSRPGQERWLVPAVQQPPAARAPRFRNPSDSAKGGTAATFLVEPVGGEPLFPAADSESELRRIGKAVHSYLAALPSLAGLTRDASAGVAARCLNGFGVQDLIAPDAVVAIGERLAAWVDARYPGAEWLTEVPVSAPAASGGTWDGAIDLLLRLLDGSVVLIDHKAGPLRRDEAEARAATYAGQIAAYREALKAQPLEVRETWIHFALAGVMVAAPDGG